MRYVLLPTLILAAMVLSAGCTGPDDNGGTQRPGSRYVVAYYDDKILHPGDSMTIRGSTSEGNVPLSVSIFTIQDFNANDLSRPVLSDRIQTASDKTYTFQFVIDPVKFPAGEYWAIVSLPTNERGLLTFRVDAPGDTGTGGNNWTVLPPGIIIQKGENSETLSRAADALKRGDTRWLVEAMPPGMQSQVGESPRIQEADAAEISRALLEARAVEMHENLIIYETTYRGKLHTFYTVKEWSTWKIVGF